MNFLPYMNLYGRSLYVAISYFLLTIYHLYSKIFFKLLMFLIS